MLAYLGTQSGMQAIHLPCTYSPNFDPFVINDDLVIVQPTPLIFVVLESPLGVVFITAFSLGLAAYIDCLLGPSFGLFEHCSCSVLVVLIVLNLCVLLICVL